MSETVTTSGSLRRRLHAVEPPANLSAPLATYQALRLIHLHAVRPELATMLAALAFGGGQS